MRKLILLFVLCVLAIVSLWVWISPAAAAPTKHVFVADFIDQRFLEPVHSVITGDMLIHNRDVHHIPIIAQMVLLRLETTLGATTGGANPKMSWAVRANNFGCVKWYATRWKADWGPPPPGRIWHWSSWWYKWKTPAEGMCGWGRFLEHWGNGWFLKQLKAGNWDAVARVYNGGSTYAARCRYWDRYYRNVFRATGEYPLTVAGWTP
jgi:hypothetical protein